MTEKQFLESFTEHERNKIVSMKNDRNMYRNMYTSIAPAVYGHDEVKKGILLMLLGGVHKETAEGIGYVCRCTERVSSSSVA